MAIVRLVPRAWHRRHRRHRWLGLVVSRAPRCVASPEHEHDHQWQSEDSPANSLPGCIGGQLSLSSPYPATCRCRAGLARSQRQRSGAPVLWDTDGAVSIQARRDVASRLVPPNCISLGPGRIGGSEPSSSDVSQNYPTGSAASLQAHWAGALGTARASLRPSVELITDGVWGIRRCGWE